MQAIEIVTDRRTLEPDKARTDAILALAFSRGLLMLSAGLHGNVIRTLMPLVVTDAELEEGLAVLESCLETSARESGSAKPSTETAPALEEAHEPGGREVIAQPTAREEGYA
jgi:4-aminobutyrate aminotransferase/(S)-3-amino-2-methylpropionate transaminase